MEDKRYCQADREARYTLGLYAFFFMWWFGFAFGLGSGDPAEYTYVWGMPAWFFYSCIVGYPVICLLLWGVVRYCFRNMPLEAEEVDEVPGLAEAAHDTAPTAPVSAAPDGRRERSVSVGMRMPE